MPRKTKQQKVVDDNTILDRLERIVQWASEFRLGFVKCNHPTQCEAMRRALLDRLKDKRVLEIFLEKPIISLLDEITVRWDNANPPDAVCVYGLEKSIQEKREESSVLGRLNHDRDLIRRAVPGALLIWLPDFALDCVVRGAPDFWAWRSGVYEFATDKALWQMESATALDFDMPALFSLTAEDKRKEIARLEELLRTARALPHQGKREQETVAHLLNQIGLLYHSLGEWDMARAWYEESLAIFRQLDNQSDIAITLHNLGIIAQNLGDLVEARRLYQKSLEIKKKLGNQSGIALSTWGLGNIALEQDNLEEAERRFKESLETFTMLKDEKNVAAVLHQLGRIAEDEGNLVEAHRLYQQSLDISKKLGNQSGIASSLHQLGEIAEKEGNKAEAARLFREALSIFEKLKSPNAEIARQNLERVEGKS